jgi:hypothetical protein
LVTLGPSQPRPPPFSLSLPPRRRIPSYAPAFRLGQAIVMPGSRRRAAQPAPTSGPIRLPLTARSPWPVADTMRTRSEKQLFCREKWHKPVDYESQARLLQLPCGIGVRCSDTLQRLVSGVNWVSRRTEDRSSPRGEATRAVTTHDRTDKPPPQPAIVRLRGHEPPPAPRSLGNKAGATRCPEP